MTISINSPPAASPEWVFIQTLSPSGVNTITSSTLPAYNRYRVVIMTRTGVADALYMRLNGDATNTYSGTTLTNTTLTNYAGQSMIQIGGMDTANVLYAELQFPGKSAPFASGVLPVAPVVGSNVGLMRCIMAYWTGGNNTQVTTLTFYTGGTNNVSGTIVIYGAN